MGQVQTPKLLPSAAQVCDPFSVVPGQSQATWDVGVHTPPDLPAAPAAPAAPPLPPVPVELP
jgi:hypothetical protein